MTSDPTEAETVPEGAAPSSRAGRNLPAALASGLGLGAVIIVTLTYQPVLFVALVAVAMVIAVWEMRGALATAGIHVPLLPSVVGSVAMVVAGYVAGGQALSVTLGLTCVAVLLWRVADGATGALRDVSGGVLVALYPGFLAGFGSLMLSPPDGTSRIYVFLIVTICSDIGGYVVGVLAGRHPLAPSISPKKSWEGFAGSVLACAIGGAITVHVALGAPWWIGVVIGLVVGPVATAGDLVESTLKRDLGIKDMGHVMPGHGGLMDRLDSLVVVAPIVWALLEILVPVP